MAVTDEPSYDAVCFHAQQCAEKYLKAYLAEHDVPFPRTHMLVDLLTLCLTVETEFESLRQQLEDLSVFGVQVRYLGFDATHEAAEHALAAASRVRTFARKKFDLN